MIVFLDELDAHICKLPQQKDGFLGKFLKFSQNFEIS